MNAIRIVKTITNDRLEELNEYIGKSVEIIILTEANKTKDKKNDINLINDMIGICPDITDGMDFQNKARSEWD